jgi:signal transduction histidine kinase
MNRFARTVKTFVIILQATILLAISGCRGKQAGLSSDTTDKASKDSIDSRISKLDIPELKQAVLDYRNAGDSLGVALSLNRLGEKQRDNALFVDAINSHRAALSAAEGLHDTLLKARILVSSSTDFRRTGSTTYASDNLFTALRLMESYSGRNGKDGLNQTSFILNGLGNVYKTLDNGDEAEKYFRQSLAIDSSLNNYKGVSMNYSTLGNIYEHRLQFDSAYYMYRKSLEYDIKSGNKVGEGISYNRLGQLAFHRDSLDAAVAYHQKAYDLLSGEHEIWNKLKSAMSLAWIYLVKNDLPKAYSLLQESLEIASSRNSFGHLEEIHYCLAEYYKKKGDYRSAYEESQKCLSMRDSIARQRDQQQVAESRVNYEREKNEIEVNKLNLENAKVRANRHSIIIFGSILAFILVMLLILSMAMIRLQRKRNKELAEINAMKNKLFSIISHDLKNPAISQQMALSSLLTGLPSLSPAEISEKCGAIEKTSEVQLELINNLLEWSRLQSGKMVFTPSRLSVASAMRTALGQVRSSAENKEIKIDTSIPADCFALTDKAMLEIVLRNILTNAIKFSKRGGEIRVLAEKDNAAGQNLWRISITDHGIGMSQETLDGLFRIDSKHSAAGTEGESGTGLGLIVCREMVELGGGTIRAESMEGSGSTFSFTIKAA